MSDRICSDLIFLWNIVEFKFIISIFMVIDKLLKDDKSIKDMYVLYHFPGEFLLMLFEQIIFFRTNNFEKQYKFIEVYKF